MPVISTEARRFSNVIKNELFPEGAFCRDTVIANEAGITTYAPGTVLGRTLTGGTATTVAQVGNTGNGVNGTVTVTGAALVGTYSLAIVAASANAGTFVVTDPRGRFIGAGTVGVAFSKAGIAFTLADGATDFALGDVLFINVIGTYKYKVATVSATDGSAVPAAIVLEDKVLAAATDTRVLAMLKGPATVSKTGLLIDASFNTQALLNTVYAQFESVNINCHDAV